MTSKLHFRWNKLKIAHRKSFLLKTPSPGGKRRSPLRAGAKSQKRSSIAVSEGCTVNRNMIVRHFRESQSGIYLEPYLQRTEFYRDLFLKLSGLDLDKHVHAVHDSSVSLAVCI